MLKNNQRHNEEIARLVNTGGLDYLIERMEMKLYQRWSAAESFGTDWESVYYLMHAMRNLNKEIMICIEHIDKSKDK